MNEIQEDDDVVVAPAPADPVDQRIDQQAVIPDKLEPDSVWMERLTTDLAQQIYDPETIAKRYGMSHGQLLAFVGHKTIASIIKAKRAIWQSDASKQDQIRQYWAVGLAEAAPTQIAMMTDSSVPIPTRVEIMKIAMKLSGMESAVKEGANQTQVGSHFSVNIVFSNGSQALITPAIAGEVVDADDVSGG